MTRRRILVADDDESLRRVMQMELEELGYNVLTAADGSSALRRLSETPVQVVITDLKMTGMELLRAIRSDHPETTVIIVTACGTVQTAVEAMKAGAYDYLTKPIDYE